jgi:hypothetical protein
MRSSQWTIAVIVLAAMVFVLTFAMNYLGTRSDTQQQAQPEALAQLSFVSKTMPLDVPPPRTEVHGQGHWDYWFENRNDRDVKVGLVRKQPVCKCIDVELFCLADADRARLAAAVGSLPGLGFGPGRLTLGASAHAAVAEACKGVQPAVVSEEAEAVAPARAVGWVRMNWSKDLPTMGGPPLVMRIWLWTDQKNNPNLTSLGGGTRILPALIPTRERDDLGVLNTSDLPRTVPIVCYSETRDALRIEAEVIHDGRDPAADPVQIGKPVRLGEPELLALEMAKAEKDKERLSVIRCAYRIDVSLRDVSPDGSTPFELGTFRRFFSLRCAGEEGTTQVVAVIGRVGGEVTVGTSDGWVRFGPFPSDAGTRPWKITLSSDVPDLDLEVDTSRVPPFLAPPELGKPEVVPGTNHKVWQLTLRVPPNKAAGPFPDLKVEALRDSAVYIKTIHPGDAGKAPRFIRIPLEGVAGDRR